MGATFDPPSVPLASFALQLAVYLYEGEGSLTLLPNIQCWGIDTKEGNDPPTARLAYVLDDRATAIGAPSQFEQLWPLDLPDPNEIGQYIVDSSDRIVVRGMYPDGADLILFDGFPRLPTAHVTPDSQAVTISAIGVPVRAWDRPITGRWERDASDPNTGLKVLVNLPCRFNPVLPGNPSGQPNCTPDSFDENESDTSTSYPVFLDPHIDRTPTPLTDWTLSKCVRYILSFANPQEDDSIQDDPFFVPGDSGFTVFVKNPDFDDLTDILDNRTPKQGMQYFDPSDSSTFDAEPIIVRDFDCTNMAWPDAIERLLGYHGFGMRWVLEQDDDGNPTTTFAVYRKDSGNPNEPKVISFASVGSPINPANQNLGTLSGSFDYHGVANQFVIETHPNRYETSFILAPGFTPAVGDETAANRPQFFKQNIDGASQAIQRKYRYYVADECGDGFYDNSNGGSNTFVTGTSLDLTELFPDNDTMDGSEPVPSFVARYRPCAKKLLTEDGNDNVFSAQLAFSRDYTGEVATLWDGTSGHWQPIDDGSWNLLDDRIGIVFTGKDPEDISIGIYNGPNKQEKSKSLRGVTSIANPSATEQGRKLFFLRLTTVIESDTTLEATAARRPASPLQNIVERRIDAKEHWRKDTVAKNSAYFTQAQANFSPNEGGIDDTNQVVLDQNGGLIVRDDTQAATDHATQLRTTHEFPAVATTFTIPMFTMAYDIGDRISEIAGRNISLQRNAGTEQQESPAYPFVVGLSWNFEGKQSTSLIMSDHRRQPAPIVDRRHGLH